MMKLVDIDKLNPSAYNPRKVDSGRLEMIRLSLHKLGFLLPIYADENGEILSGHQRHYVAKQMGINKVPVSYTCEMNLSKRKAVNILFNRATNDFRNDDTPGKVTAELKNLDIKQLAKNIKNLKINSPEFYPCMNVKQVDIYVLLKMNHDKWNRYSRNLAGSLLKKKILMPIVITPDYKIINGIGRLQLLAEKKYKTVPVVFIEAGRAEFASAMLNLISMDFDIHTKYEDLLRYNSFRRAMTNRAGLGIGLFVGAFGSITSKEFKLDNSDKINKWKTYYGGSVLDFGAGHLTDTAILKAAGIEVTPFEPYLIKSRSNEIDKEESIKLVKNFLIDVEVKEWRSIFISSVLNSIPFLNDRQNIVRILAACSSENTTVHAWAMNIKHKSHTAIQSQPLSETDSKQIRFKLDYENGIILGGFSDKPKVQKYHTPSEIKELFSIGFSDIKMKNISDCILAVVRNPIIKKAELIKAIEFEFNLPYPDGSRMNLVKEAKKAFSKRLGIKL